MTSPNTDQPRFDGSSSTREQVRDIKDRAIGQARDTFRDARDRATSSLDDSRSRVADQIGGIANGFRQASGKFRDGEQARAADLTNNLADHVDQVATYLREKDARAMVDDLGQLARRQPAVVIGGALAIGVLAGRFLKSSERRGTSDGGTYGHQY